MERSDQRRKRVRGRNLRDLLWQTGYAGEQARKPAANPFVATPANLTDLGMTRKRLGWRFGVESVLSLLIVFLIFLAIWFWPARAHGAERVDLAESLQFARLRAATMMADSYCRAAGCTLPVHVAIGEVPEAYLAHMTVERGWCVLHLTERSAKRKDVVAHEACHCALDSDVIGPYGYEGIGMGERRAREKAAARCGERVAGGGRYGGGR